MEIAYCEDRHTHTSFFTTGQTFCTKNVKKALYTIQELYHVLIWLGNFSNPLEIWEGKKGGYVELSLRPYSKGGGLMSELHDEVYCYLDQIKRASTLVNILEHLQDVTKRSRGDLMSRIALEQDSRFVQLSNRTWGLRHWECQLHNDTDNQGVSRMLNQETISPLLQLMSETLTQMKNSEKEIPNRVIELFESEDLQGIQRLMEQKKQFSEFTTDLRQFLDKWMTA
jgi:hypothetical protein